MGFSIALMILLVLVCLTIMKEYRRTNSLTLLSFVSLGNILYMGVNPAMYYYNQEHVYIFELTVSDAGMTIDASGLIRVLLAAAIFQLVCLCVSLGVNRNRIRIRPDTIQDKRVLQAVLRVGWFLVFIGVVGVIWMGLKYNGHPWGLYEISYTERSPLARDNYVQAFMLLVGMYGVSQLIVGFLLSHRMKTAVFLLLAVTLHGIGMKSKFPIFWVLLVFLCVAISQRRQMLWLSLPIGFTAVILGSMSVLRGFESWSELPQFIEASWDLLGTTVATPWQNDLPGPASITYYVINSNVEHTLSPLTEVLWLLVPRFIFDRGPVLSDVWAAKMMGSEYEPGLGFGWSAICDGFLLASWAGIALVAFLFAMLARYIDNLGTNPGRFREFFVIILYCSAPFFLFGVRESTGGLIKSLLIATVLVWLPTFYLAKKRSPSSWRVQLDRLFPIAPGSSSGVRT